MINRLANALTHARGAALLALLAVGPVAAGPGAHGPDGEHLEPRQATAAGAGMPRIEAKSELFELVAHLNARELSILVDRYETNEPVLGARLELESGVLKATAAFRAERGDYAVTDGALLKALQTPGEHALVFTLTAGSDADLLDGTLVTAATDPGQRHAVGNGAQEHDAVLRRAAWIGAGVLALGLVSALAWWRQRPRGGATGVGEVRP